MLNAQEERRMNKRILDARFIKTHLDGVTLNRKRASSSKSLSKIVGKTDSDLRAYVKQQ
jgi:hypothetical protein